ncbi:MAG: hypothetical protein J0H96_05850 [Microbacterium ginsengisoli]|nr:hypothetical protein [Microbacterium ginsengisoli]
MTEIAHLSTGEIVEYDPVTPIEVEQMIRELGDRLERAVPVIKGLWADRYATERKYIEERAKAVMRSTEPTVTRQRAEADLAAMPYKHEFDNAKEILHAAEELQRALTAKLNGYLNLNRALTSAYFGSGASR